MKTYVSKDGKYAIKVGLMSVLVMVKMLSKARKLAKAVNIYIFTKRLLKVLSILKAVKVGNVPYFFSLVAAIEINISQGAENVFGYFRI